MSKVTNLLYCVSHPIQYQAPLLRLIAAQPDIRLRVVFERDPLLSGTFDPGFGRDVVWDIPLRQGYDNVIAADTDLEKELRKVDVVWMHGWQSPLFRRVLRQAALLGKPVLMRGENCELAMPDLPGWRGLIKRLYLRSIFRQCWGFLAIGSANARYYREHGIAADRIFSMPYAVDNKFFAEQAQKADVAALRSDLGIAPDRKVVLFSGKFSPRKNPHVLLRAWQQARWPGTPPALLYVGDGEMADFLRAESGDGVIFAGFRNQSELPAYYALADVFVLASHAEPWGLAVNEAMACGRAVIVSDQCGCAEDLVDSSCGALVPAGDEVLLGQSLVDVVGRSREAGAAAALRVARWDFAADVSGLRQALSAIKG